MRRIVRNGLVVVSLATLAMFSSGCSSSQKTMAQDPPQSSGPASSQLIFSTYLGGTTPCTGCADARTFAQNTVSDAQGNTYVTGGTRAADLPVLNAWQAAPAPGSGLSAFVAKYDTTGKLLWLTYLGGRKDSIGVGAAVMPDGGVAISGLTTSDGSQPFPTMNAFQPQNNGQSDYFVAVFDATGKLHYSTYLGGTGVEGAVGAVFDAASSNGNNIAVDTRGLIYVTGMTNDDGPLPVKFPVTANAIQSQLAGGMDSFLCIVDPSKSGLSSLVYGSYLGGLNDDKGHGIAVNAGGDLISVGGYTNSSDFPTTSNAFRSVAPPSGYISNGYITQFKAAVPAILRRSTRCSTRHTSAPRRVTRATTPMA